ncbi:MAG: hypothetical protein LBB79_03925 [Prevotellaceae bacterium]|nr:hypothetical protein [Prevotellaceae bacterium]
MLERTAPIDTPKHSFKNFDEARKWAKENIVGTYRNDDTGEDIYISKTTIEKYTSESAIQKSVSKDVHLSTLKKLPVTIKTAVLKETKKDRVNNPHIVEIQRLYGAIKYEDKIYLVKITVKVTRREGNRAYSYEVMEKENPGQSPGNLPERTPGDRIPKSAVDLPRATGFSDSNSKGTI